MAKTANMQTTDMQTTGDQTSYFLVFYIAQIQVGTSYGNVALQSSMPFLNEAKTVDFIKSKTGFTSCTITNIIRLTKEEYYIWNVK